MYTHGMPGRRLVALLRAVNVGPTTQVPMARLREVAVALGYRDVATHGRSGNLVMTAAGAPAAVAAELSRAITDAVGFRVPVIVRTRDEVAAIAAEDPFAGRAEDPAREVVVLLDAPADPDEVRSLLPADPAPEAVHIALRHIRVWSPEGVSRSQVLRALSRRGGPATHGTVRNRRTLAAILALCDAAGPAPRD